MKTRVISALIIFTVLASCNLTKFSYEGDGTFDDYGPSTGNNRYRLFLGQLDMSRKTKHVFIIGDLPDEPLVLSLVFKPENSNSAELLPVLSKVVIRVTVSRKETGKKIYEYAGVLYKDGYIKGQYFREGLEPAEIYNSSRQKCPGLSIYYTFDERLELCGIKTPFYDNFERIVEMEILEPCCGNICYPADVIIQGGGWE